MPFIPNLKSSSWNAPNNSDDLVLTSLIAVFIKKITTRNILCLVFAVVTLAYGPTAVAFAGQGAIRMLYAVPYSSFVENPSGDSVGTITDASGSITTLQALINNARNAYPSSIIIIHLLNGATYSVSSAGLVLGSEECLVGTGATIMAANSSVTVPLIIITAGETNVSVAGGTLKAMALT